MALAVLEQLTVEGQIAFVLAAVVLTAFGRDLLPSKAQIDPAQKAHGSNQLSR